MAELALLEKRDGVAHLTLNRPDARNALSLELIESLRGRIRELSSWDHVNVCIVTGAGKAFCAGMDLRAVIDDPHAPAALLKAIAALTIELRSAPMVTLARVNGAAIGGGCGLVCVCDLAVAHADAKLGFPEVDLGVCPAVVAPWLACRIGAGAARRMLLEGGLLSGEEAMARGLITGCAPDRDGLDAAVGEITERLRAAGHAALRATKSWLGDMEGEDLARQTRKGALISAEVLADDETRAALKRAFESRR